MSINRFLSARIFRLVDRDVEELAVAVNIIIPRFAKVGLSEKECVDLIRKEWIDAVNKILEKVETEITQHKWSF